MKIIVLGCGLVGARQRSTWPSIPISTWPLPTRIPMLSAGWSSPDFRPGNLDMSGLRAPVPGAGTPLSLRRLTSKESREGG